MAEKDIPKDVQALLTAASEQLEVGELLHGDDFSLAAVMSAAEIGDPRLDAGTPHFLCCLPPLCSENNVCTPRK